MFLVDIWFLFRLPLTSKWALRAYSHLAKARTNVKIKNKRRSKNKQQSSKKMFAFSFAFTWCKRVFTVVTGSRAKLYPARTERRVCRWCRDRPPWRSGSPWRWLCEGWATSWRRLLSREAESRSQAPRGCTASEPPYHSAATGCGSSSCRAHPKQEVPGWGVPLGGSPYHGEGVGEY